MCRALPTFSDPPDVWILQEYLYGGFSRMDKRRRKKTQKKYFLIFAVLSVFKENNRYSLLLVSLKICQPDVLTKSTRHLMLLSFSTTTGDPSRSEIPTISLEPYFSTRQLNNSFRFPCPVNSLPMPPPSPPSPPSRSLCNNMFLYHLLFFYFMLKFIR